MKILIVDDERNIRESLKKYLSLEGIDAAAAESGEAALEQLDRETFDAIVLDLRLPGMSGQEALGKLQERGIPSPVIMISAHGQIADAVEALKAGAKDYLVKPFDPAELIIKLKALVENKRRENVVEAAERTAPRKSSLIGESPAMGDLSSRIDRIALTDATVLITGESGTGKEVAAREIHLRGRAATEPFVAVNVGGIHEGLMESELFGHEKGSFTGAVSRKSGLFELAGRGTIFLDEIGEMPLPLQVKLLRVLQERKIRRLGGLADIPVNARIISATHRDLEAMVKEGRFREDLYYRLNVVRLGMPPLRDRPGDIPLLAAFLLDKLSARMGRPVPGLSPEALERLRAYPFPGNIRELENILERALIYSTPPGGASPERQNLGAPLFADLVPTAPAGPPAEGINSGAASPVKGDASPLGPPAGGLLEDIEKKAILDALARSGGNRTRAAEVLGVSRKTILNKIKAYGIG